MFKLLFVCLCVTCVSSRNLHPFFSKLVMSLNGYNKDQNGKYPVLVGKKYGILFLACEVNFMKPVKIKWLRNSQLIESPPPYYLPWKKGSVLMIRPLIYGKTDGVFECIASNGKITERRGINITIKEANSLPKEFPKIKTHPGHVRTLRLNVDFHCIVSGKGPIKIMWFHNRVPLSDGPAYKVSFSSTSASTFISNLMIKNVTSATKGFYQCLAMNQYGVAVSKQANMLFRARFARSVDYANSCDLNEGESGHAGKIRSLRAICKHRKLKQRNKFYYEVSWEAPQDGEVNVSQYMIGFSKCMIPNGMRCHRIPGNETKYILNLPNDNNHCANTISVVAEPIIRDRRGESSMPSIVVDDCYFKLEMPDALLNGNIKQEENFTFRCDFEGVPEPSVTWRFTKFTKRSCETHNSSVIEEDTHVLISKDKRTLQIIRANEDHTGMYVCSAQNEFDSKDRCGFLEVDVVKQGDGTRVGLILTIVGSVLLITVVLFIMYMYKRKKVKHWETTSERSVYISHCSTGGGEKALLELAASLQMQGVHVLLDLCHKVAINDAGGMSNWLQKNMTKADKIMVLLSRDYLNILNANDMEDNDMSRKVRAEFNLIRNLVCDEFDDSRIIIVTDGVVAKNFPDIFVGRSYFPFPTKSTNISSSSELAQIKALLLTGNAAIAKKDASV